MTKEEQDNFDLDVLNALAKFPKDDDNGVAYVRVKMEGQKIENTFLHTRSSYGAIQGIIYHLISKKEIRTQVLNAMLNFFKQNKDEIADFSEYLRQIKNENL